MRVVLDTNVLIAALIAHGACAEVLEHCAIRHSMVSSEPILKELHTHLIGKFKYSIDEARKAVELLESQMDLVIAAQLDRPVCRDPDDDMVLGTAIAGQADCIVTGDKDLLVLQQYENVAIVSPATFAQFESDRFGA